MFAHCSISTRDTEGTATRAPAHTPSTSTPVLHSRAGGTARVEVIETDKIIHALLEASGVQSLYKGGVAISKEGSQE